MIFFAFYMVCVKCMDLLDFFTYTSIIMVNYCNNNLKKILNLKINNYDSKQLKILWVC